MRELSHTTKKLWKKPLIDGYSKNLEEIVIPPEKRERILNN